MGTDMGKHGAVAGGVGIGLKIGGGGGGGTHGAESAVVGVGNMGESGVASLGCGVVSHDIQEPRTGADMGARSTGCCRSAAVAIPFATGSDLIAVIGGTGGISGNVRTDDGVMGRSSSGCTRFTCRVRVVRRQNSLPHPSTWHLYGRFPECVRRCLARELVSANALKHSVHT